MDNVVTEVLAFEGNGRVNDYVGGYSDWVRQGGKLPPAPWAFDAAGVDKGSRNEGGGKPESTAYDATAKPARKVVKLSYKLQRELDSLPATIESLEAQIADFEAQIADPGFYRQDAETVSQSLEALSARQAELDAAMERWMELEAMAQGE
ncbi:hypothetical protein [Modicisalibacter zincidurans]